jgi:Xaa-Pro aminopeptidase
VDHGLRRTRLAARLGELGVEAFLVTRLPNVRYLTGFTGSNGQLIVTSGSGLFVTDGRYVEQARHEVPDLEHVVDSERDVAAALAGACARLGVRSTAFESAGVTYELYEELRANMRTVELVPARSEIERLRWVKEPEELRLIEAAQGATDAAFRSILGRLREGVTEVEVALELELALRRSGADGIAFDSIVAFGENAAEPHHDPTGRPLRRGDVVKLDFGGLVGGYRADMTRTIAFGELDPRVREAYEVVRDAQRAGVDAVRAGASSATVDEAARRVVREAGLGDLFPHGLGHGVGLEIHEGPWLRSKGTDVLPAGAVVTVEPGVYIPEVGGVRVEDMVEVTDTGARVIPRTSKELLVL